MEEEMRARPTLKQAKTDKIIMDKMENEIEQLKKENSDLHNELMLLRNNTNGYI